MASSSPAPTRRSTRAAICVAAVVALGIGASACGSDPADEATLPSNIILTTTSVPNTSMSIVDETTTTIVPTGVGTPEDAAANLYNAWKAGDTTGAGTVATPAAIEGIFEAADGEYALYNRCDTGEFGDSGCLYRGSPGTIQFQMEKQPDGKWIVVTAVWSAP